MVYGVQHHFQQYFSCTFVSWPSVLLVEEIRVPRENHRPVIRTHNVSGDRH